MVVLAASILTKNGKYLLSRQFVEMSRIRIEGLLTAFPKLMGSGGKQYTYIETETVRYLYQPIETLFLVLITNRSSNIVEDLETLRLFGRLVPDICPNLEEETISKKAYDIIFAFDEVVHLGFRENITLEQVNTFLQMDSYEEKLVKEIKQRQVQEATVAANTKARQLQKDRKEGISGFGGISSMDYSDKGSPTTASPVVPVPEAPKPAAAPTPGAKKAMTLAPKGGKGKEDLISRMVKSGELEEAPAAQSSPVGGGLPTPVVAQTGPMENVHISIEEKIVAVLNRDGGFQSVEITGGMFLLISDQQFANVKVRLNRDDNSNDFSWKAHPNINKVPFQKDRILALKEVGKGFPTGTNLSILRWRLQNMQSFTSPITVNCWPGDRSVMVEYEMEKQDVVLVNVTIAIPMNGLHPTVQSLESGSHRYDAAHQVLYWTFDRISEDNNTGSMEVQLDDTADASQFFPVAIAFAAESTLANLKVVDVVSADNGASVVFSQQVQVTGELTVK